MKKGYSEVKIDLGEETKEEEKEEKKVKEDPSKLPKEVAELIRFIHDKNLIQKSVEDLGYDPKQLPLGKLDHETLMKGFHYLCEIEKVLNKTIKGDLSELTSKFYTYIPHVIKGKL